MRVQLWHSPQSTLAPTATHQQPLLREKLLFSGPIKPPALQVKHSLLQQLLRLEHPLAAQCRGR